MLYAGKRSSPEGQYLFFVVQGLSIAPNVMPLLL